MGSANLEKGFIFLLQTGAGILGNSSLLCLYNFSLLTGHKLRPTDLIVNQLVLANNLVLFSKGIPHTMAAFGLKNFLDDVGCKLVFYLHRVARGVSLSTACLLSGFQAIKLYSRTCMWMEYKMRSPKCIVFCCSLCWILHLLTNAFIPMQVVGPRNSKNAQAASPTHSQQHTPPKTVLRSQSHTHHSGPVYHSGLLNQICIRMKSNVCETQTVDSQLYCF
nr:vomeronasal type-1 receptor 1 isoform X3 [Desmodus rotundus]